MLQKQVALQPAIIFAFALRSIRPQPMHNQTLLLVLMLLSVVIFLNLWRHRLERDGSWRLLILFVLVMLVFAALLVSPTRQIRPNLPLALQFAQSGCWTPFSA